METHLAVAFLFPLDYEGPEEHTTFNSDKNGRWPIWDSNGDEVCTCGSHPVAESLCCILNAAYGSEDYVGSTIETY